MICSGYFLELRMKIFLTGATGFIGGHVLRALSERGHQVTCLVRPAHAHLVAGRALPGVTVLAGDFTQPETWIEKVKDHDVIINAVGIIRETGLATFNTVHTCAPIALFDAAARLGISKIIQISALGADAAAQSQYHLSKRDADQHLAGLGVPYVILRPSFVYGPQDQSMTYFMSLAALPITPVPGDGEYLVQPIHVDDLVRAVVLAVERPDLRNLVVDAGGAAALRFNDMFEVLARRLGKGRARLLRIPWTIMALTASLTDVLGRGPITTEELGMLRRGSHCDNRPFVAAFGFEPVALEPGIARKPLTEADRRHALLTHLRVPLRLSIAFIWLATGLVSAFISATEGFALLAQIGITGKMADLALYGTSLVEIALGLATAVGWRVRWMGAVQLLPILGFMIILTLRMPQLWLHPFGPLTKNIPLLGATLVMMAWED
jgi:uncharacterized protein YbjT (DUF2867 family)